MPEEISRSHSQPHTQEQARSLAVKPKRIQVRAACVACQHGKAKCDAIRPCCSRCAKRGHICEYDVEADTSRSISLRRRNESLKIELEKLRSLLEYIRTRPDVESMKVYRRIRAAVDPMDVVRPLRDNDLLLQHNGPERSSGSKIPAFGLENLELGALEHSPIKVHAQPWTSVAGDGIISELIFSFFAYDNGFHLSFVDQECFLEDMQAGKPDHADFCSSLLVNAICALRCSTCERARVYGSVSGFDIRERFLDEARRLLDSEYGRRSLTTVQALLVLYTCYTGQGRDRGGLQYRHAAYEMLKRLQVTLEAKFRRTGTADKAGMARYRRAISRLLWGIYCFESISASAYLQPSLIRAPAIPRRFVDDENIDPAITEHLVSESEPQLSACVLNATCDLSEKLVKSMEEYGSTSIDSRIRQYQDLREWGSNMPSIIRVDTNFCPETSILSTYQDIVALSLFRPPDPRQRLPDGLGTSGLVCLHHCRLALETLERYRKAWPYDDYSIMNLYPLYHIAITLLNLLHDDQSHDLFERVCSLLTQFANDFPLARYILQALKSVAVRLRLPLPQGVASMFRDLNLSSEELADVPVAFVLPADAELCGATYGGRHGAQTMGVEIGEFLGQCSRSLAIQPMARTRGKVG